MRIAHVSDIGREPKTLRLRNPYFKLMDPYFP